MPEVTAQAKRSNAAVMLSEFDDFGPGVILASIIDENHFDGGIVREILRQRRKPGLKVRQDQAFVITRYDDRDERQCGILASRHWWHCGTSRVTGLTAAGLYYTRMA